jgi:shikimate kinase / 3-dehydroquinate synthase
MVSLGRALVFIGFMGAGKSTAAAEVAAAGGGEALDSDRLLEARFGHPVAREFELYGEQAFRAQEEELVCGLLENAGADTVIALGGGAVLSPRVRTALAAHVVVLLDIDVGLAWRRTREVGVQRPLARDADAFAALHAERRRLYEELADAILPAQLPGLARRALPALGVLAAASRGPAGERTARLVWATSASGDYPVLIGPGLLGAGLPGLWQLAPGGRAFCITDETVGPLYAQRLGALAGQIAIPPGESHKTLASAERVWRELAGAGMTRADRLLALGGGVVGDLAGFCAATYQRGVPVVQVPTTLVAQVDSAYGGKTGVDLPEAKNYVGAYHQPAAVIVDPDTLKTLPAPELQAGWVEVLKTALIAGGELWRRLAADEPVDEHTILACARLKLGVVAEDERDGGRRQALNLGHTVGHAIETATGYARYRHGEAVGLGLLAALRLSGQEDLRVQVHRLLVAHQLPVTLQGASVEDVVAAVARDKKRLGNSVPFVLVDAPGEVRVGCEVAAGELHSAVAELA